MCIRDSDKTVHVIFPSEVRYVDLGSPDLIAGKADGAENVIRVKACLLYTSMDTKLIRFFRHIAGLWRSLDSTVAEQGKDKEIPHADTSLVLL